MRWEIESSYRELKYAIGLTNFHSRKDDSIKQEIFASLIMYNLCERITAHAVVSQSEGNKHIYQVNFTMAIYVCLQFYRNKDKSPPPNELTEIIRISSLSVKAKPIIESCEQNLSLTSYTELHKI